MKKIIFIIGTRADYGHLMPLIDSCINSKVFDVHLFVTGTHVLNDNRYQDNERYGRTIQEIKNRYTNLIKIESFYNGATGSESMGDIVSNTIRGFSKYIREEVDPDLVVIFGDRIEQLGAAISSVLENILTIQIEAGDISGTIDESLRHSISKLCHAHFVSNKIAKQRLISMGEKEQNIFVIGCPSVDFLLSLDLSKIDEVKDKYKIKFLNYSIFIFHPVTTEYHNMSNNVKNVIDAIIESNLNYIAVAPNCDLGSELIWKEYERLKKSPNIRLFSSLPFKNYLTLLKNSDFIIGNSSSGVIEAPYLLTPTIDIGTRQNNRYFNKEIIKCDYNKNDILKKIKEALNCKISISNEFGNGDSGKSFLNVLNSSYFWNINKQKSFIN